MDVIKRIVLTSFFIGILCCMPFISLAQEPLKPIKAKDLVSLSLEELLNVEVDVGTLTGIQQNKIPLSLTTITKEDIESSPHRNLLDLMEAYVPGATYVNHWLGPRIGMRGVMGDQNSSYLLLVNGENMNSQSYQGAEFELRNKDLTDIEKIEITRGPGSVVYGPGAIGGVISITTKNAKTEKKSHVGLNRDFTYNYSTLSASYSLTKKSFSAYLSGSVTKSMGIENPKFYYIDRAHGYGYGYMDENWGNKGLGSPAPNFYEDFQNKPESKINLEIDFLKELKLRARYTNFSFIKQQQKTGALEGPAFPGLYGQQLSTSLIDNHSFTKNLKLVSSIGFQTQSHGTVTLFQGSKKPFNDITQRQESYAENKLILRSILTYTKNDKLKLALGTEYNNWFYSPEWGQSKNSFLMSYPAPIRFAVFEESSGFYKQYNPNGLVTVIENTIGANQLSGFFEVNYRPAENTTFLVSGRLDNHNLAQLAFSPRAVIIQELDSKNYLRLVAQQSVRLPGFRELYTIDYANGKNTAPEKLQSIELIFTHIQRKNFTMNASAFFQSVDQIAWLNDKPSLVGNFETAGFETDISYKINDFKCGINYSYIKQLRWMPENDMQAYLSRIGADSINVPLVGAGSNRINNFPQHQFKVLTSYALNQSLFVHFNGRVAFGYGQMDMLNRFKSVHDTYGLAHTRNEMSAIFSDIQAKGYGKPSFTSNMSLKYKLPFTKIDASLTARVMNLLSVNNVRYVYQHWEVGNNRQYPRQVGFIKEPLSFNLSMNAKF